MQSTSRPSSSSPPSLPAVSSELLSSSFPTNAPESSSRDLAPKQNQFTINVVLFDEKKKKNPEENLPANGDQLATLRSLMMQINPSSPPSIPATSPQLPLAESENVPESSSTLKDHKFSLNTMLFNVKKNDAVKISLANQEQWAKFHEIGTEMMVFNSGRRLFPLLAYKVSGLDPHKLYCAGVHMIPDSAYKQEYDHDLQQWVNCLNQKKTIFKPTSEILGRIENGFKLMSLGIDMSDVKIFNIAIRKKTPLQIEKSRKPNLDKTIEVLIQYKYLPVIKIYELSNSGMEKKEIAQATFPETSFVTVSIYRNQKIKEMKTLGNKYCRTDRKQIVMEQRGELEQ